MKKNREYLLFCFLQEINTFFYVCSDRILLYFVSQNYENNMNGISTENRTRKNDLRDWQSTWMNSWVNKLCNVRRAQNFFFFVSRALHSIEFDAKTNFFHFLFKMRSRKEFFPIDENQICSQCIQSILCVPFLWAIGIHLLL